MPRPPEWSRRLASTRGAVSQQTAPLVARQSVSRQRETFARRTESAVSVAYWSPKTQQLAQVRKTLEERARHGAGNTPTGYLGPVGELWHGLVHALSLTAGMTWAV